MLNLILYYKVNLKYLIFYRIFKDSIMLQ